MAGLSDLSFEHELYTAGVRSVIGMDEVGRGCIAGPVGVGAVFFDLASLLATQVPAGLRDSKKISATQRPVVAEHVRTWAQGISIAYATPAEIDEVGMTLALSLAGKRALAALPVADLVLLDGNYDWLSKDTPLTATGLFDAVAQVVVPPVKTFIKGDDLLIPIAAASVLAKVDRDQMMADLAQDFPHYGWDANVGYPTPAHKAAVYEHGVTVWHRMSFKL